LLPANNEFETEAEIGDCVLVSTVVLRIFKEKQFKQK
jgi:hypothetical protein